MLIRDVDFTSWQPILVPFHKLKFFFKNNPQVTAVDQFADMLEELFLLRNPRRHFEKDCNAEYKIFKKRYLKKRGPQLQGVWFYFPWLKQVVHFLPENEHLELRTGRNRQLITLKEQSIYYNAVVSVLGMSVGSHAAITIAMTGGAKYLKLADPDIISGSNLNRIRTGFNEVGLKKVLSVARKISEINPYSVIEILPQGLTDRNLGSLFTGRRKVDIIIEEMDNPYMKLRVRYEARSKGVPVIMAADNEDGVIVDVERYDINRNQPVLHGLIDEWGSGASIKKLDPKDLPRVIAKIAGADLATTTMLESVLEVGKTLYSWPQLGTAATLCGSVLANLCRRLILKQKNIVSGRYEVNMNAIFENDYHSKTSKKKREEKKTKLLRELMPKENNL